MMTFLIVNSVLSRRVQEHVDARLVAQSDILRELFSPFNSSSTVPLPLLTTQAKKAKSK